MRLLLARALCWLFGHEQVAVTPWRTEVSTGRFRCQRCRRVLDEGP